MAEVKNSFLKSKMNKDLDSRLLPNGEYRDGMNISISKSENANVGALENILGNDLTIDIGVKLGVLDNVTDLQIIGQYTDERTRSIYFFLTNHIEGVSTYSKTATNWICSFNLQSREFLVYSTGAFLNFSTQNIILNVNLLENILYWTDNRNQPRKININNGTNISSLPSSTVFYTNEDQISVAKLAPYASIDLYKENNTINETTLINATSIALPEQYQATVTAQTTDNTVITIGDFTGADLANIENYYVWSSDGQLGSTEAVKVEIVDGSTNQITISKAVTFSSGHLPVLFFGAPNPTYNELYPGDATFLEDKFVRFSYRYRFIDGEYSIMAPFTQICFIPKQYGFFLENDEISTYESTVVDFMQNQINQILLQLKLPGLSNELLSKFLIEEIDILYKESTGISVSVVDTITLDQLINNGASSLYEYDYQSTEPFKTLPEIQTTRVYDKVPVKAFSQEIISNRVVYANYQNKHTPPVSLNYNVGIGDKFSSTTPQSNQSCVAYPNHTIKQNRNYQVGVVLADRYGRQSTVILSNNQNDLNQTGNTNFGGDTFYAPYRSDSNSETSVLEWNGDSIKVLFNSVIQSNKLPATGSGGGQPGLYNGDPESSNYNPTGWYTYKIVVKQTEQEYYNVYLPGILNGVPAETPQFISTANGSIATLTLFSDNINKVPRDLSEVGPDQRQFRSSVRMWGRVSPQILTIDASFPTNDPKYNQQYYPDLIADTVASISVQNEMFGGLTSVVLNFEDVYDSESNPILARVSTRKNIGSTGQQIDPYPFFLSVYETEPTESRLDIYWETSTSGLISELNNLIETSIPGTPNDFSLLGWKLNENIESLTDPYITNAFWPTDIFQDPIINSEITLFQATGQGGQGVIADSRFELERTAIGDPDPVTGVTYPQVSYRIKINSNFVFLESSTTSNFEGINDYILSFTVENTDPTLNSPLINTITESESLQNTAPSFGTNTQPEPVSLYNFPYNSLGALNTSDSFDGFSFGQNGSELTGAKQDELRWNIIVKQFGIEITDVLIIDNFSGIVTIANNGIASGQYDLIVTITDAAGFGFATSIPVVFIFGKNPVNCQFNQTEGLVDFANPLVVSNVGQNVNELIDGNAGLVFWSSTTSVVTSETIPAWNSFFPSGYNPTASPDEPITAGEIFTQYSNFDLQNTKSINLGNGPEWCTAGNSGLTQGTGYIIVTLQIENPAGSSASINQDFVYASSNIILQKRNPVNSLLWEPVRDLENEIVDFGDNWLVDFYNTNQVDNGADLQLGSLESETLSSPNTMYGRVATVPGGINPVTFPMLCASKAFALFKPGDLRLCINNLNNNLPQPSGAQAARISITYGDFYYPNQQNDIAYSYRVYNVGQLTESAAKNVVVGVWTTVYAREPLLKYVSEFFVDISLTTTWEPSISSADYNWFAYEPAITVSPNSNFPIKVNNAYPDNPAKQPNASNDQYNRRYVAKFNVDGTKNGLSEPRRLGN